MKEPGPLPFLARPGYRRRRLVEAIRLMPYVGVLLVMFPLLWATGTRDQPAETSEGWLYVFGVWFVLIALAALLGRAHRRAEDAEPDGGDPDI